MSTDSVNTGVWSAAADRGPLAMDAVGLCKDFKLGRGVTLHAVKDASLSLYQGAVVALVGESGSGKSTIARLLAGQEHPTAGTITLDGQPVSIGSRRAFRHYKSSVQLVFQDPFASLNPAHTVRHHLERPVRLHQGSGVNVAERVAALMEQVRLLPTEQYLAKYPHELSGGQRQRVSFARALAAQPKVLLADEPVSMLDVSIRLEMLSLLDDLRQRLALALLYITHDIASARYFADEVLVMYAGEIVERGPAEDVTQHPAHPYTQLLIASAPDPDNLGSLLRAGSGSSAARARGAVNGQAAVNGQGAMDVESAMGAESAADARAAVSGPAAVGCPFSTRCPLAYDRCRRENPVLRQLTAVRAAACWRLEEATPELFTAQSPGSGEPN